MGLSKRVGEGLLILLFLFLIIGSFLLHRVYLTFSFLILGITFLPLFIRFERRKLRARELVLLAVLGALAAVSRVPFAAIPSVQPTSFVVIVSGLVFGGESGFVVGCLAALVSNLFLGQGPWTPWQMMAWGIMGGGAGLLKNFKWMTTRWGRCLYGLISGYFFGWIMDFWSILGAHLTSWKEILALYGSGFYFDTAHAGSNLFFLFLFSSSWIKILGRFKKKYGLLELKKHAHTSIS